MHSSLVQFDKSDILSGDNIRHGFFTRIGGHSDGIFSSLNAGLGSGDNLESVQKNRADICAALGFDVADLATLHQFHSNKVFTAEEGILENRPKADGIVTNRSGIAIGVVTADCGPILFADKKNGVVGAAHAGWRGAFDGVLENTIKRMEELGAERSSINASLGPTISQKNYEVGPEFQARFVERDKDFARFFTPFQKADHFQFDLHDFIMSRLERAKVNSEDLKICTYEDEDRYFSFRRTTHRNEDDYGRQLSVIGMQ